VGSLPDTRLPKPAVTPAVSNASNWFWANLFGTTNPTNPLDVNNDQRVDSLDVLMLINEINRRGDGPAPAIPEVAGYMDANENGFMDALDVLIIINHINRRNRQV
jgi:hypothetical protein